MLIEHALCEEDEYIRLQKLTQGIKEFSCLIPTLPTFDDSTTLKYLICSYPFQKGSVELLISFLFDHFASPNFVLAFHKAALEVAQLQEQKALLCSRSLSLKSSRIAVSLHLESRRNNTNHQFCRAVYHEILNAKKFICLTYLKKNFELANNFNLNLEKLAQIFKVFIINTKDQQFIHKLIELFDECKSEIFGNRQWVGAYYEEIDQYFLQTQQNLSYAPSTKKTISTEKNIKVSFFEPKRDSSESGSNQDLDSELQDWLSTTENFDIMEQENIFGDPDNFDEFLKYIFIPEKISTQDFWDSYLNIQENSSFSYYYKLIDKQLKLEETIRSYRAIQVLIKEENFNILSESLPQFVIQIFNGIYDCLSDYYHNANLNHIAQLVEILLQKRPKQSAVQFVDLNLFFLFGMYHYNPQICRILENLLNFQIDKYQLGQLFQEQLWKYLCKSKWFEFISQLILKQQISQQSMNKHYKCENTISILSVLKTLSQYDNKSIPIYQIDMEQKELLTKFLGMLQEGKTQESFYTINQFNWQLNSDIPENISYQEIEQNDKDKLKQFVEERKTNTVVKQYYMEIRNIKKKTIILNNEQIQKELQEAEEKYIDQQKNQSISNHIPQLKNSKSKKNLINLRKTSSSRLINRLVTTSSSYQASPTGTTPSPGLQMITQVDDTPSNINSAKTINSKRKSIFLFKFQKQRHNTESSQSNDGFSSSRLRTLYPSYKTSIRNTEYEQELQQLQFDQKYLKQGLTILCNITKSIIQSIKSKTNQSRLDYKIIWNNCLSEELLNKYFQFYMFDILNNNLYEENVSEECGLFINTIFINTIEIQQLECLRTTLLKCFLKSIDYFGIVIYQMHKNPNFLISYRHKFRKCLLMDTLCLGFKLLIQISIEQVEQFIIKHLNESIMHILVIWFFDSEQNNHFQRLFLIFIHLYLNIAPECVLQTLFFKIGFIQSLQNAQSNFIINGMKKDSCDNLFFYTKMVTQCIIQLLQKRNLIKLEKQLKSLESWRIISNNSFSNKILTYLDDTLTQLNVGKFLLNNQKTHNIDINSQSKLLNQQRKSIALSPKLVPLNQLRKSSGQIIQ